MNVHLNRKAELFYKALEDIWVAEQSWFVSPNIAVWSCTQAVEKILKGFLRCVNMDYDHGHELEPMLENVLSVYDLTPETKKYIMYLNDFKGNLRYKNMTSDPTPEEARIAIARTKYILQEFSNNNVVIGFINEAKEVHAKLLKSRIEEYSSININNDKPEDL
ncbi:MAG: HEPN domain-containing protein [Oscillospiraceae bacterium]|jgi:HEPN domain-containing protein|nr:HEPN domain-containing protein [Oscillospiraceae bacterium]